MGTHRLGDRLGDFSEVSLEVHRWKLLHKKLPSASEVFQNKTSWETPAIGLVLV